MQTKDWLTLLEAVPFSQVYPVTGGCEDESWLAANPSYMYGSHFGAIPQVDAGSATAMVMVGAVVGAVASAVLVGSDPVKNAKLRSMVSSSVVLPQVPLLGQVWAYYYPVQVSFTNKGASHEVLC